MTALASRRRSRSPHAVALLLASAALVLGALPLDQARAQLATVRDTVRPVPLFVRADAIGATGFVAGTALLLPFDRRIALELSEPDSHTSRLVAHASTNVEYVADPGAVLIGVGMYGAGRLLREPLHGLEAVVVGGAATALLKGVAGRARPFTTADTNPRDFAFGRGFGNGRRESFPSGHTTAAFAAAATVTWETHRWWPRSTWIVAPLLYGGATMVGASRMYHDRHWTSDVVLGAGIGTFAGLKVARFNHGTRTGNRFDRLLLGSGLSRGRAK